MNSRIRIVFVLITLGLFISSCEKSNTNTPASTSSSSAPNSSPQFGVLYNFNTANGSQPFGDLTLSGNVLYGMTSGGGANRDGCIFAYNLTGGGYYKDLFDFNGTNGQAPEGSLILLGNVLYGMTVGGGANNDGCIFSINTDGSGYKDIYDFSSLTGANPLGSLIPSGNILYGMAQNGGSYNYGCVFSFNITNRGYKDMYDFNNTTGAIPYGTLILSGRTLFGTTHYGGAFSYGCIFSMDTNSSKYRDILDFNGTTNGQYPGKSLVLSGNVLYGITAGGGVNNFGTIFSVDTSGSGYEDLLDFDNMAASYGADPVGGLILSGNTLYGMTWSGGFGFGTIFSVNTNGSGFTNLLNFTSTNGRNPQGSLILSGNILYGMAYLGGTDVLAGDIFSLRL